MMYVLIIAVVALYLSVAPSLSLPLPAVLTGHRVASAILTWVLAFGSAVGLDVLWLGLSAPFRGRMGMHTLTALAIISTALDGLYSTFVGRDGPLPFAAMALVGLFFAMLGTYQKKMGLYLSCRTVAGAAQPYRVTLDEGKWKNVPAFTKEAGTARDFGSQIQGLDGAERIYRVCVPVLAAAGVVAAVVASVGRGRPGMFTWCLSAILVACAPLTGLMAYGYPYLRLTRRLDRSGAVLAGWDGVESMTGKANILVKDEDLFPEGSINVKSIKRAEDISLEKLTGCTASMLRSAGSGLYHIFDSELRRQGGFYRRVDDLQCYEAGGLSADIREEQVLVGTSGFMTVMGIVLESGLKVKKAVYCVINRRLQGVFFLNYEMSHYAKSAMSALVRGGVRPVLVTRDFNVIPSMLQNTFDLPVEEMEYPPIQRRRELSEPGQPHNVVLGALVTREGMGAYSDAVIGGRRLYTVVRINAILAVVASVVGLLMSFLLTMFLAFDSLSPLTMMIFLLLWAVPTLAIGGAVDRF
jgi:cation transport ATPase